MKQTNILWTYDKYGVEIQLITILTIIYTFNFTKSHTIVKSFASSFHHSVSMIFPWRLHTCYRLLPKADDRSANGGKVGAAGPRVIGSG